MGAFCFGIMLGMSKFKSVSFDLGGVVVDSAVPKFFRYAEAELKVTHEQFSQAFETHRDELERGTVTPEEFWKRMCKSLGVEFHHDPDLHLWTEHFIEDSPIRTEVLDLADRLRENGYKVGMLSNTTVQHVAINTNRHIFEHFDPALMSNEIHAIKPEAKAYQILADKLGLKTEEIIFVDDLEENVAGANATGMHGIKYSGYAPLVKELRALGVKVD